jgi:hypothetical protein
MGEYIDIFGNVCVERGTLRDRFSEPPFSLLDARQASWQRRKAKWLRLGIKEEAGRNVDTYSDKLGTIKHFNSNISVFDASLCELMYQWFCPVGGSVLDPFCGGSVRGIVAGRMGLEYTGIDIREEQIAENERQVAEIGAQVVPRYITGDSAKVLDTLKGGFDFVFSCPPYANLEVYSDLEGDISNMEYGDFLRAYSLIISKSCALLRSGGYAVFVVGEVRDSKGNYLGFVPDTIKAFRECGMAYYNEMILATPSGSACMRSANPFEKSRKITKTHQNVLCFRKE